MKKPRAQDAKATLPLVFTLKQPLPSGRLPVLELVRLVMAPQLMATVEWARYVISAKKDGAAAVGPAATDVAPRTDTLRYQPGEALNSFLLVTVPTATGLFSLEVAEHGATGHWGVVTFMDDGPSHLPSGEAIDSMNAYLVHHGLPARIVPLREPYAFCGAF